MSRVRNYCLTYYGEKEQLCLLKDHSNFRYLCAQQEKCAETGNLHWQAYVEFTEPVRITTIRNTIGVVEESIHCEKRRGTQEQAIAYCKKEDSAVPGTFFEEGEKAKAKVKSKILELIDSNSTLDEIRAVLGDAFLNKVSMIAKEMQRRKAEEAKNKLKAKYVDAELRPWQVKAVEVIGDMDPTRKIVWIYDEVGNTGKSFLGTWLAFNKGACIYNRGKATDLAHMYNYEPMVVFDMSRDDKFMPYKIMEDFVNGRITSPKYDGTNKFFEPPRVVVLSNSKPEAGRLSEDRYIKIKAGEDRVPYMFVQGSIVDGFNPSQYVNNDGY